MFSSRCFHGMPSPYVCTICQSMAAQLSQSEVNKQQIASKEQSKRMQEADEKYQREKEIKRISHLNQLIQASQQGEFLVAWSYFHLIYGVRSIYIEFLHDKDAALISYHLANVVLNDTDFFNSDIEFLNRTEKLQLLLCLLCFGHQYDKDNFLLRRTLSILHNVKGDRLPTIEDFFGKKALCVFSNKKESDKEIYFETLALNPYFTVDSTTSIDEHLYDKFNGLKYKLFSIIDKLVHIRESFPDAANFSEMMKLFQISEKNRLLKEEEQKIEREKHYQQLTEREQEEKCAQLAKNEKLKIEKVKKQHDKNHRIIDDLIEKSLKGIKAYQGLRRTIFNSHLGFFAALFDNKRGLLRANAYHFLLSDPIYGRSQKCLILIALLINNDGVELKRQIQLSTARSAESSIQLINNYLFRYDKEVLNVKEDIVNDIMYKTNHKPNKKTSFVI